MNHNNPEPTANSWYLAMIVVKFIIEGSPSAAVHKNLMLVQANNSEGAYEAALEIGMEHQSTYINTDQRKVTATFAGLAGLVKILDPLTHGSELMYWSYDSLSEGEIMAMLQEKDQLSVFRELPDRASRGMK